MRLTRNPSFIMDPKPEGRSDRRRHGRLRCEQTSCCVGSVVDLSASGMRVQRRGKPLMEVGDEFKISVHPDAGEPMLTLPARVVWIERQGFRKHVYGLEFAELDDVTKRRLGDLARMVTDQVIFRCA